MPRTVFNMQASEFDYSPEFNTLFSAISTLNARNVTKQDELKEQMYSCFSEVFERQQEVGEKTQQQIKDSIDPLCEKIDKTNEMLQENNKLLKELIQVLSREPESPKHKPSLDADKGSSEGDTDQDEDVNLRPSEFRPNLFIKIQGRGA